MEMHEHGAGGGFPFSLVDQVLSRGQSRWGWGLGYRAVVSSEGMDVGCFWGADGGGHGGWTQ